MNEHDWPGFGQACRRCGVGPNPDGSPPRECTPSPRFSECERCGWTHTAEAPCITTWKERAQLAEKDVDSIAEALGLVDYAEGQGPHYGSAPECLARIAELRMGQPSPDLAHRVHDAIMRSVNAQGWVPASAIVDAMQMSKGGTTVSATGERPDPDAATADGHTGNRAGKHPHEGDAGGEDPARGRVSSDAPAVKAAPSPGQCTSDVSSPNKPTQLADGSCRVHTCVKCGELSPGMGRGWKPSPEPSPDEWQALVKVAWQWLSDEYGKSEMRLTPWQIRRDVHAQSLARLLREHRPANPSPQDDPHFHRYCDAVARKAREEERERCAQLLEALANVVEVDEPRYGENFKVLRSKAFRWAAEALRNGQAPEQQMADVLPMTDCRRCGAHFQHEVATHLCIGCYAYTMTTEIERGGRPWATPSESDDRDGRPSAAEKPTGGEPPR